MTKVGVDGTRADRRVRSRTPKISDAGWPYLAKLMHGDRSAGPKKRDALSSSMSSMVCAAENNREHMQPELDAKLPESAPDDCLVLTGGRAAAYSSIAEPTADPDDRAHLYHGSDRQLSPVRALDPMRRATTRPRLYHPMYLVGEPVPKGERSGGVVSQGGRFSIETSFDSTHRRQLSLDGAVSMATVGGVNGVGGMGGAAAALHAARMRLGDEELSRRLDRPWFEREGE